MRALHWIALALFWGGIISGRVVGGPEWAPAWLGVAIFVLIFPVHWRPANLLADRIIGLRESGEG